MTALKPCLGPGETLVPCLSESDACTIYPVRPYPEESTCCRAKATYMQGELSLEQLEAACQTLAAQAEGFEEVGA